MLPTAAVTPSATGAGGSPLTAVGIPARAPMVSANTSSSEAKARDDDHVRNTERVMFTPGASARMMG